jgi:AraC-like DNA-binding protein
MTSRETSTVRSDLLQLRRNRVTGIEAVYAQFHAYAYDMHAHDDEWLVGVTHHGTQDFFCRGRRQQSTSGRIILIEPSERHDGRPGDPNGYSYSMLYIPRGWLRDEFGDDESIGFRETLAEDYALVNSVSTLCKAVISNAASLTVEHLRDRLVDRLRHYLSAEPRQHEKLNESAASRALDFLRAHYAEDISSAELVKASGAASRFQLSRSFKSKYGTSPHASLIQVRIAKARAMLRQNATPAQAAASCGFADQSHMTRWFQRAYGIPPGAYARGRTKVQDCA